MSFLKRLFLSKAELDYLTTNRQFGEDYRYTIKSRLQKKIQQFARDELPLLVEQGYLDLTEFCKLTEYCKESNAKVDQADTALALEVNYSSCTVRSSIANARVAPNVTKSKQREAEEYEKQMLRPGFEPGISDSKGLYLIFYLSQLFFRMSFDIGTIIIN